MLGNFAAVNGVLGKATPANQTLVRIAARVPMIEFAQIRLRFRAKRPPPHFVSPLEAGLERSRYFLFVLPYAYLRTTARTIANKSTAVPIFEHGNQRSASCSVSTGTD